MKTQLIRQGLVPIAVIPALAITTIAFAILTYSRLGEAPIRCVEALVFLLQIAGVIALVVAKLAPESPLAGWTLVGIQLGLGVSGTLCAGYRSNFALFAGATLGALLVMALSDRAGAARGDGAIATAN